MIYDFRHTAACSFAVLLLLAGCGRSGGLTEISGRVTYDGQPLQKGTIAFMPADGQGPTAAAVIADGKYSVKVAPGSKRIKIEAFQVTGRRPYNPDDPNSPMVDVQAQILPKRYNANSNLTRDIAPDVRVLDFTLEK